MSVFENLLIKKMVRRKHLSYTSEVKVHGDSEEEENYS
jgi:hypothetical protein